MSDLTAVRATWGFLQTLHPLFLFADTLPSVDAAEKHFDDAGGQDDLATEDEVENLKNEITMLRTGLKLNIVKTQMIDIDDLAEDWNDEDPAKELKALEAEVHIVLDQLEQLVHPRVLDMRLDTPLKGEGPTAIEAFPKLVALRARLRESEDQARTAQDPHSHEDHPSMQAISNWSQRYSTAFKEELATLILYPRERSDITSLRKSVERFGQALLGTSAGVMDLETQTMEYSPRDVSTIESAHAFASLSSSLHSHMTEVCKRCETPHQAKLHMSGFKEDSIRLSISTCEESDWVSAVFTSSSQMPSRGCAPFEFRCKPEEPQVEETHIEIQQVIFNSTGMWTLQQRILGERHHSPKKSMEQALDQLLADRDRLTPKYRKLAEVLLAACVFQLNESPWLEQYLRPDYLYVPPLDKKRLKQWCPRLLCDLVPQGMTGQQSDNIAAFGVLLLELEAHRQAFWTSEDEDWPSGEPSNSMRLIRILKDWEESVESVYRRVAKACLDFESLVQNLDHEEIAPEKKSLAIIYKCILEPLLQHTLTSFQDLSPLFTNMFGPSRGLTAAMDITAEGTAKRALFDDDSDTKPEDRQAAAKFLHELDPFFKRIKDLYANSSRIHFPTHERVRIAVLDSGIDEEGDTMIHYAIKAGRINPNGKSFVGGRPGDWMRDSCGHGTHVTRLLLKTAPAAEIFVAKICTGKLINSESMPGIAQAIKWAVDEVDAHIISMSFGFEDECEEIEDAIDDALEAGKLIIAAASNNGGVSGRARPARQDGVICMHATDGLGNKGSMNPSPLAKDHNFATLGVAVPLDWQGEKVWKSGTSFAAPIAAGFAAGVLELVKYRCGRLSRRQLKLLHRKQGMGAILKRMAEERDGYDFIYPDRLARDWSDEKAVTKAAKTIESILADI